MTEKTEVKDNERGRPTFYGETMKQTSVWMPQSMIDWLKGQPAGMSETMRSLIKTAMETK